MIPITSVMTKEVFTVKESTSIYEAMALLTEHKISGLPVVDDDMNITGILSEKDVLRILLDHRAAVNDTVSQYMSTQIVSFPDTADAIEICQFFVKSNIRRVPIARNGKLVGIVSRRDIVALIIEAKDKLSQQRFH